MTGQSRIISASAAAGVPGQNDPRALEQESALRGLHPRGWRDLGPRRSPTRDIGGSSPWTHDSDPAEGPTADFLRGFNPPSAIAGCPGRGTWWPWPAPAATPCLATPASLSGRLAFAWCRGGRGGPVRQGWCQHPATRQVRGPRDSRANSVLQEAGGAPRRHGGPVMNPSASRGACTRQTGI